MRLENPVQVDHLEAQFGKENPLKSLQDLRQNILKSLQELIQTLRETILRKEEKLQMTCQII